jgi:hypothetical protein
MRSLLSVKAVGLAVYMLNSHSGADSISSRQAIIVSNLMNTIKVISIPLDNRIPFY